jgi:structural maintenance of chromosome 4
MKEKKSTSKADEERMNLLKAQVMQHEGNITELKTSSTDLQQSINACQAQILEAGGTRYKAQRSKVNDLRDQLKLQEKRLLKAANNRVNLEKKNISGASSSSCEAFEAEFKLVEAEISEIDTNIESLTKEAFAFKQESDSISQVKYEVLLPSSLIFFF